MINSLSSFWINSSAKPINLDSIINLSKKWIHTTLRLENWMGNQMKIFPKKWIIFLYNENQFKFFLY